MTSGRLKPEIAEFAPSGIRRMSASPHANAELRKKLRLPDFREYAVAVDRARIERSRKTSRRWAASSATS